jgi:serine/threonine protein kinase
MSASNDSLICPLTFELFRDPVVAQDGHTYERIAIEQYIRKNGRSPITKQALSIENLIPNLTLKKIVDSFETLVRNKSYQFILDVDVRKRKGRPLFSTTGKAIHYADWLPSNDNRPGIVLLKVDGARAKKEASFYVELSRHPHIIRTFGLVHENNNNANNNNAIMLLQEYAPEGSLYEMLVDCGTMPDERILIEIFLQIIDAMAFLAYNHVVHGDLACRNVLVFRFDKNDPKKIVVKVTDFGLSRHSKLYSMAPGAAGTTLNIIPTRYAAPEILSVNATPDDYTEKSDIYSMGILMWEAYSQGALPWSQIERDEEVIRRVMRGDLLSQPENCSQQYWSVIAKTWAKLPNDRPTFSELRRLLTEQYHSSGNYHCSSLCLLSNKQNSENFAVNLLVALRTTAFLSALSIGNEEEIGDSTDNIEIS